MTTIARQPLHSRSLRYWPVGKGSQVSGIFGTNLFSAEGAAQAVKNANMQDVFAVADRVIVMRRGSNAGERKIGETNENEVVGLMVGAEYDRVIKQMHNAPEVHITTHEENEQDSE
jgi:ABC-type sugar transport system ATPase subunit